MSFCVGPYDTYVMVRGYPTSKRYLWGGGKQQEQYVRELSLSFYPDAARLLCLESCPMYLTHAEPLRSSRKTHGLVESAYPTPDANSELYGGSLQGI